MPRANEVKRADVVEIGGQPMLVREIEVQNPSARGAATLYKMRLTNVRTRQNLQETFKGDDLLRPVDLVRRKVNYSYLDGAEHVFMDEEDFSEYRFAAADIAEDLQFITDGIQGLQVLLVDGEAIALQLPAQVELVIAETPPPLKGASATARSKPAHFATGLVIQVPDYLETGERVRVHTVEKRYLGRAE